MNKTEFGKFIKERRNSSLGVSLRIFAAMVGISPTYLSKIERGEFPPPGEEKIVKMACLLSIDSDVLLAMAGKVATDLQDIIKSDPYRFSAMLRRQVLRKQSSISKRTADREKEFMERVFGMFFPNVEFVTVESEDDK